MRKNRENLAKLFFIIFIFSLIISYAFTFCSFDHECMGEDCTICYEINLMKSMFDNLLIIFLVAEFINQAKENIAKKRYILKLRDKLTPITLKVEMLD